MQNNGIRSIECLDYSLILKFHAEDYHSSQKSKDVYEDLIRVFLRYLASIGKCPFGLSFALNKLLIPQIIRIPDEEVESLSEPGSRILSWDDVLHFLAAMEKVRYGKRFI